MAHRVQLNTTLSATSNTASEFQPSYKVVPRLEPAIHAESIGFNRSPRITDRCNSTVSLLLDIRTYN
jgi:hypothetical protein